MVDHALLTRVLVQFARTLVSRYEVSDVLYQLVDRCTEVLDVAGAGVSILDDDDQLRFVSATDDVTSVVERSQEDHQEGPCVESISTQAIVAVDDLGHEQRWPGFRSAAASVGLGAVAGIPMLVEDIRVGTLNIYRAGGPHRWSEDELSTAQLLADVATIYVLNAREHARARDVTDQLQQALDSRIVIEQAKGILAARHNTSLDAAFQRLRNAARARHLQLRAAAQAVVDGTLRP